MGGVKGKWEELEGSGTIYRKVGGVIGKWEELDGSERVRESGRS